MVSTKTFRARDPDHSERTKPSDSRSNRGPRGDVLDRGEQGVLDDVGGEELRGVVVDRVDHGLDPHRADGVGDVGEAADQPEDERRQREQGEEPRLGGQPGDAVAHADADGRDDEPGQREQAGNASEHPAQAPSGVGHVANRNRRTLQGCGPTSSPTSSRPRAGSTCCAATRPWPRRSTGGSPRRTRPAPPPSTTSGELAGTPEVRQWADQADRVTPVLRTHAATGERVDEVEFHPAYHALMRVAVGNGLHGRSRGPGPPARAHTPAGRPGSWSGRRSRPVTSARSR